MAISQTQPTIPVQTGDDIRPFINEVEKLIDNIIGPWNQLLLPLEDRPDFEQAWAELKQTLNALRDDLDPALRPDLTTSLKTVGLSGTQQVVKFKRLNRAWEWFKNRGTVRRLRELLKWVHLILGSLSKEIPGAEALKEFVEAIRHMLEKVER